MRVLFIVSHAVGPDGKRGVGGAEKRTLEVLGRIDRKRVTPIVVYSSRGVLTEQFRARGLRVIDFHARGIEHLAAGRVLERIVRDERIDVVDSQGPLAGDFYAARAAKARGLPFVLTRHLMVEDYLISPLRRRAYAVVDTLTLRAADVIVTVSEDARRRLLRKRALRSAGVLLIRNGVDTDTMRPRPAARERLLAEFGLAPHAPTVGMVGQLTDDKGWDVFLDMMGVVRRACPRVAAFVVGAGPRLEDLRLSVQHADLAGTVFLLGLRGDIPDLLPAFDVVAHTSRREGLPMVVIEAMACGRPVVASDAGGTAELIVPGRTGFVVAVGDAQAAADRVVALLRDSGAREAMGRAARERAVAEFGLGGVVSRYESLYEQMVRGGARAGCAS